MTEIGFSTLLGEDKSGPIIQTFLTPSDPNFRFERFYEALRLKGFTIYPGKLTKRPSFRIGTIGQIDERVIAAALQAIKDVLGEMGVKDFTPLEN
jgi:2-aminoethylphosphonate-pyruvate transaminase